ncbi:immunoglobulin alpha-2 heavy chain-like [Pseudophryne corroboree]|uniref:immunoglobulin alpha-2 heavy chain-like n=1 Tax=Pseudophryne corroboree TaxID=495146 RepID=UPI0030817207
MYYTGYQWGTAMNPFILLLLSDVIVGRMVLYQPQDVVSAGVNDAAVIRCVANEDLEAGTQIAWYRRRWRTGEAPLCVISCLYNDNTYKYACKNAKHTAVLQIRNIQADDTGVYYCTAGSTLSRKFGNGTTLIVADSSTPSRSVHLLAPARPPLPNTTVPLACVVHGARHTVHVTWKISGTHHRGSMISMEEPGGTSTFLSFISLPRDTWDHGDNVSCDVWFTSSPVSVHWRIPEIPERGTKTRSSKDQDSAAEDSIVYSQLDINHLTKGRK